MKPVSKEPLVRKCIQVYNPNDRPLVVWLEPWGEEYELKPHETFDIAFVGPDTGQPQIAPKAECLSVYGWEGSEGFVFQNRRLVGYQPTIAEILQQELDIAGEKIRWTAPEVSHEEITLIQHKLDEWTGGDPESVSALAAWTISELTQRLHRSEAATKFVWAVAKRIVNQRGLLLITPAAKNLDEELWNEGGLRDFILHQAFEILPSATEAGFPTTSSLSVKPHG